MRRTMAALLAALILLAVAAAEAPPFTGAATVTLGGRPQFLIELGDADAVYLPLDALGRAQGASAVLGPSEGERRSVIADIIPTGWQQATYAFIPGLSLYNRCHLIAHRLGGADVPENIIAGTQYLNRSGIGAIEDLVAEHIEQTGHRVRYEVIPQFYGDELVCRGVVVSVQCLEDEYFSFFEYCHNIQIGVAIDYATGRSAIADTAVTLDEPPEERAVQGETEAPRVTFVLNTSRRRFHLPDCPSVDDMNPENRRDFYGTREELIDMNYVPCGRCHP